MATQDRTPSGALYAFGAFGAAFAMSQFFRAANGVLAKDLIREFTLTPEALGVLTGAFFIAFGVAQIPIGILFDRYGPRRIVSASLILAVGGAVYYGLAADFAALLAARILQGLGFTGVLMGALLVFSRWLPAARFGTWMGRMIALGGAGGLLATLPLAAITAAAGWRVAAYGGAGLTALSALAIFWLVRDAPPGHAMLHKKPESLRESLRGVRAVWRVRGLPAILGMCLVSYPINISLIGLWAAPYLVDVHGQDRSQAGTLLLAMAAALILANLLIGPLERRLDTRKGLSLACALGVFLPLVYLAVGPTPPLSVTVVLLALISAASCYNVILAGHARALFPDRLAGRGMALVAIGLMGGPALMQSVTGVIAGRFDLIAGALPEGAYRAVFGFFAGAIVLATIAYLRVPDARPSGGFIAEPAALSERH